MHLKADRARLNVDGYYQIQSGLNWPCNARLSQDQEMKSKERTSCDLQSGEGREEGDGGGSTEERCPAQPSPAHSALCLWEASVPEPGHGVVTATLTVTSCGAFDVSSHRSASVFLFVKWISQH